MKRRSLMWVAAGAAAAVVTAGCATGSETAGGEGTAADADSVVLIGDRADFVDSYAAADEELRAATGYGLQARNVPSTENYQQVVRSSLSTESSADIVKWWSGYRLQDLARGGQLEGLDAEWDRAVEEGWVNPDTRDSFAYDGTVYAVPMYKSYWVIFYNTAVYDELGLEVPTTWEQFESNAEAIRDAGITPLFATQSESWMSFIWFEEILSKLDPDFYVQLTQGEASYLDPPAREAMAIWADWYARGFFTAPDTAWDNEPALFREGEVAMVPMGTWRNAAFADAGLTEEDYDAFVLPTVQEGTQPSVIIESGVFAVPSQAPNADAARELLGAWLSPEVQEVWSAGIGDTSANPGVVNDDAVLSSVSAQVAELEPVELERYWESGPPTLVEGNVNDLGAFMVDPTEENAEVVLTAMQERADQEWAAWEAQG